MSDATNPAFRNLYMKSPDLVNRRQQLRIPVASDSRTRMRNSQAPGVAGYLVGPIVGPDRRVDGVIKQKETLRYRATDPMRIKRSESIAHRFGVERHQQSHQPKIPLAAMEMARQENRARLMRQQSWSASVGASRSVDFAHRPTTGRSGSWVSTSSVAASDRRLSGSRGCFFVRPDSVPQLKIPTNSFGGAIGF